MILVVGSGIAGLWSALTLARSGQPVTILTRGSLTDSNTWFAQGGVAAALEEEDSPDEHFLDTIEAGAGLCDPQAVRVLVEEGPSRVRQLMKDGFLFDREGDRLALGLEGAHRRRRILHAGGDATGARIEEFLTKAVLLEEQIRILDHFPVDSLLSDGQGVQGVLSGNEALRGDAVILATGGAGALFSFSTNPPGADGSGILMAYHAGASLTDLEFMQFHPTCLRAEGIPPFLISEAVRGEGAILRNGDGGAFMKRYHPLENLAPRDVISRAIFSEMRERKENHVWLDIAPIGKRFNSRFPSISAYLEKWGMRGARLPVAPAAHYFMGGIKTDLDGKTDLEGLYAVGEAAATGVHGANRLASNSLLEGMVFAHRAAESILGEENKNQARRSWTMNEPPFPERSARKKVQGIMDQKVGLLRDRDGLTKAMEELAGLRSPAAELAFLIAEAALWREESRGGHCRSDFPSPSPAFERHHIIKEENRCPIYTPS